MRLCGSGGMKSGCTAGKGRERGTGIRDQVRNREPPGGFLFAGAGVGFGAGKAFAKHRNLAGVVSFMFADVEPLAEIVRWSPRPGLVRGEKPGVILLAEF